MRSASESPENTADVMRATFVVDRALVAEFRKIALRRQRTFSGELRKLIEDEVARERELEQAA